MTHARPVVKSAAVAASGRKFQSKSKTVDVSLDPQTCTTDQMSPLDVMPSPLSGVPIVASDASSRNA